MALALSIASEAIDDGLPEVAIELLAWARHVASRVAAVREAYGVASYLAEDYTTALSELTTYRRLTGRVDQNHVIADCLRAQGRDLDRVVATASELAEDDTSPPERRVEAVIVWAAALADAGDVAGGRSVLRRTLAHQVHGDAEHVLRLRSFAADLALRAGDVAEAREHLGVIAAVDPALFDAGERLLALDDRPG